MFSHRYKEQENPVDCQYDNWLSKVLSEHRKDEKMKKLVSDWLGQTNFKHFLTAV
jgi:hypothetical protein